MYIWVYFLTFYSMKVNVLVAQSCLTLWDPMDFSLPGYSVHGILQTRILEYYRILSMAQFYLYLHEPNYLIFSEFIVISGRAYPPLIVFHYFHGYYYNLPFLYKVCCPLGLTP